MSVKCNGCQGGLYNYPKALCPYCEIATLRAELVKKDEALSKLIEASDESDNCQYGTLSTSFVRDIAKEALAAINALEKP